MGFGDLGLYGVHSCGASLLLVPGYEECWCCTTINIGIICACAFCFSGETCFSKPFSSCSVWGVGCGVSWLFQLILEIR